MKLNFDISKVPIVRGRAGYQNNDNGEFVMII